MESQIKNLLEKYWAGETSLEEEKALHSYFEKNLATTQDARYFKAILEIKRQEHPSIKNPKKENTKVWYKAAAVITIGVLAAFWSIQDNQKSNFYEIDDPKKALELTQTVFGIMSNKIDQGRDATAQFTKMEEIKDKIIEANEN